MQNDKIKATLTSERCYDKFCVKIILNMFYFKVMHKYKLIDHYEKKEIGIYTSLENAKAAIEGLSDKPGFKDTVYGFKIKKVYRPFKPRLLDKTFWIDGYDTYTYKK